MVRKTKADLLKLLDECAKSGELPNGSMLSADNLSEWLKTQQYYGINGQLMTNGKRTYTDWNSHIAVSYKKVSRVHDSRTSKHNERTAAKQNIAPFSADNKTSTEESGEGIIFTYDGTTSLTSLEDALKFCKVDLNIWEVERHVFNSWDVTMGSNEGPTKRTNYQVKIWFKRKTASSLLIDNVKSEIKNYAPKYPVIKYKKDKNAKMLEISIYDLHYGKLCHQSETGNNYDSKIAATRFMDALQGLVSKSSVHLIDKIVFVIGNDFFNADGISNASTAGTPQDNDTRWQKMFKGGRELLVKGIEYLMQIAPVEVVSIFGNHARQSEFYVSDAIECWFHNCKNVTVNNNPRSRKYIKYGNGLLGLCHGDTEKVDHLPMLMATEVPNEWSTSRFRYWHLGHLHHERKRVFNTLVEDKAVVIQHLSSLSGTDAWHDRAGYVGSKQAAEAFVWDKEYGIESMYYHTIS